MLLKVLVFCFWVMPAMLSNTNRKCPMECNCSMDEQNRYQAICTKGGLTAFPANQLDPDVKVIIIKGPRNAITIGPLFRQFLQLEILRITDSNIPAIGAESFWGLKYLRILDLSKNNITNITENNFRGQDNLHEMDLSKNKILRMASSTFRHLTDLRRLNLADNSIVELVQRNFFMLNRLKYLDLSGNPLQDLQPDVFRDVPELKVLKCRNCQLKKINPQVYNLLPFLTELDLGRNEFKFLDKEEFHDVKRLNKVLLDGNQLSVVVDELFRMQKSLLHLDLSYNRLAKVPNDSFLNLVNLTFLDLSYNKLVRLEPQSVRRLNKLRVLNISGNILMDLHEIRSTFEIIPNLTHLSIADMGILPVGLLTPFKQLRFLNISGNHLDNMSLQVLDPCRELEFLDLSRNQLYGINEDTAVRIQGIRNVRLDNNPLICDECHMGKLIDVVRRLQWKWETYPICFLPKTLRGAEITDLDISGLDSCLEYITDEEQNAASTSHNFLERGGLNTLAILGGIIFVLIAIIILSMAVCFSKHRARYYTREDHLNDGESKCLEKSSETSIGITPTSNGGSAVENTENTEPTNSNVNNGVGKKNENVATNVASSAKTNNSKEINFKFPIDDRVCTIDEIVMPSPSSSISGIAMGQGLKGLNSMKEMNQMQTKAQIQPTPLAAIHNDVPCMNNIVYNSANGNANATTLAAVAAAATVIPPGAPTVPSPKPQGFISPARSSLPSEAVVVVLPPPLSLKQQQHLSGVVSSTTVGIPAIDFQHQQIPKHHLPQQPQTQQNQQQQQMLHLTTLEPLVSVN